MTTLASAYSEVASAYSQSKWATPKYCAPNKIVTMNSGRNRAAKMMGVEMPATMPSETHSRWRCGSPFFCRWATMGNMVVTTDQVAKNTMRPIRARAAYCPAVSAWWKRRTSSASLLLIRICPNCETSTGRAKATIAARVSRSSGRASGSFFTARRAASQVATKDRLMPITAPLTDIPSATSPTPISSRVHIFDLVGDRQYPEAGLPLQHAALHALHEAEGQGQAEERKRPGGSRVEEALP